MRTTPGWILLSALLIAGVWAYAADLRVENPYNKVFAALAAPDYPARAAAEVKKAEVSQQLSVTALVVRAAVGLHPASAPAVVASISHEVPDMAAMAAYTAAAEQPQQAAAIATAAAAAAPSQAGKIVNRLCVILPAQYHNIALAVAKVAPDSSREILSAVAETRPALKASIDQSLASRQGTLDLTDVAAALARAEKTNHVAGVGDPPDSPTRPAPVIPPGGLNYSKP